MKFLFLFVIFVMGTSTTFAQQANNLDSIRKKSRITNVTLSAPSAESQREGAIKYLKERVGKKIDYCIFYYGGKYDVKSGTTYLYFGAANPKQYLTVLINKLHRKKFDSPITKFVNKEVCIKGVVLNNNGSIEVDVTNTKQLTVVYTSPYPIK
jgi:hypothetical protein